MLTDMHLIYRIPGPVDGQKYFEIGGASSHRALFATVPGLRIGWQWEEGRVEDRRVRAVLASIRGLRRSFRSIGNETLQNFLKEIRSQGWRGGA